MFPQVTPLFEMFGDILFVLVPVSVFEQRISCNTAVWWNCPSLDILLDLRFVTQSPLPENILSRLSGSILVLALFCGSFVLSCSHSQGQQQIRTGAEQTDMYLPVLAGKRLGMVANQTSVIGRVHLIDSLISNGGEKLMIQKIFLHMVLEY